MQQIQTVVVVGAGVSGLQTARALLKRGLQVLILEQGRAVGGVWHKTYPGLAVQVPHEFYEFAEFPWPAHLLRDATFPSSQAVQAYTQAYAEHFGLVQHIRFRCQLLRLQPVAQGGWAIIYLDQASGLFQVVTADYVVVATGMYCVPNVPVYKGMQHFRGLQLHANDLTDPALLAGKRVVVVGNGRSALDCASMAAASQQATRVTWLFRQAHWPIPQQVAPGIPMQRFLFSSLPSLLLPPYYTANASKHGVCAPFKRSVWRCLQRGIARQFGLKGALLPVLPLQQDLLYYGQVVDAQWNGIVQQGLLAGQVPPAAAEAAAVAGSSIGGHSSVDAAAPNKPLVQLMQEHSCLRQANGSRSSSRSSSANCSHHGSDSFWHGVLCRSSSRTAEPMASKPSGAAAGKPGCLLPPQQEQQQQRPQQEGRQQRPQQEQQQQEQERLVGGRSSDVVPLCGEIERFGGDCLLLRSGGAIYADTVLYCTGYSKLYDYLDEGSRARLGLQKDGLPLYRHMLPPLVPGLAFVGCEASSYNTLLTSGLQAEWLAAVLVGQVAMPEQAAMQEDVQRMMTWMRSVFPAHRQRASAVQLYMAQYHAQLLQDMRLQPPHHRWLLQPLKASDYRFVFTLPLALPVQAHVDLAAADSEEWELGMQSVTAAAEHAKQTQKSFTAAQLASAAAAAATMSPSGNVVAQLRQQSLANSTRLHSAGSVAGLPAAANGLQQQQQRRGSGSTSTDDQIHSAFPEQPVLMAAAIPAEDDAGGAAVSLLQLPSAVTHPAPVVAGQLPGLLLQVAAQQQLQQQANIQHQSGLESSRPQCSSLNQHAVEARAMDCQQGQQEERPVSSSINLSMCARSGSGAIWSGSNAWLGHRSPLLTPSDYAAAGVDQELVGALGEAEVAPGEEAMSCVRVASTSTFGSSSHSLRPCSHTTGGDNSAATAAPTCPTGASGAEAAAGAAPLPLSGSKQQPSSSWCDTACASVRTAALQAHKKQILQAHTQLLQPIVNTVVIAAAATASSGAAPEDVKAAEAAAAALDGGGSGGCYVSAPSTPKFVASTAFTLPPDCSSRTSLATSAAAAATDAAVSRGRLRLLPGRRRSSSSSFAVSRPTGMSAGSARQRSSSLTSQAGAAAAAAAGAAAELPAPAPAGGAVSSRSRLVQQYSQVYHCCTSVDECAGDPGDEITELTQAVVEQHQLQHEQDDEEPIVLPGPCRQVQAVQRWLDSLPPAGQVGNGDDPGLIQHDELQHQQQRLWRVRGHGSHHHMQHQRRHPHLQQHAVGAADSSSSSRGSDSSKLDDAPLMAAAALLANVLGGLDSVVASNSSRHRRSLPALQQHGAQPHDVRPCYTWEQLEAAVAEWHQYKAAEPQQLQEQEEQKHTVRSAELLQQHGVVAPAAVVHRAYSCPCCLPGDRTAAMLLDSSHLVGSAQHSTCSAAAIQPDGSASEAAAGLQAAAAAAASETALTASAGHASRPLTDCAVCGGGTALPATAAVHRTPADSVDGSSSACAGKMATASILSSLGPAAAAAAARLRNSSAEQSMDELSAAAGSVALRAAVHRTSFGGQSSTATCSSTVAACMDHVVPAPSSSRRWLSSIVAGSGATAGCSTISSAASGSVKLPSRLNKATTAPAAVPASCMQLEQERMAMQDKCAGALSQLLDYHSSNAGLCGSSAAAVGPAAGKTLPPVAAAGGEALPSTTRPAAASSSRTLVRQLSIPAISSSKVAALPFAASMVAASASASVPPPKAARAASVSSRSELGGAEQVAAGRTAACGTAACDTAACGTAAGSTAVLTAAGEPPAASSSQHGTAGAQLQPLSQQQQDKQLEATAQSGGRYEFYSQHQHKHPHQRLHHRSHEQHPLASLKAMLHQMREASEALELQQQQAALIADLASRQRAAVASMMSTAVASGGSSGAAAASAAAAAGMSRAASMPAGRPSDVYGQQQPNRRWGRSNSTVGDQYGSAGLRCHSDCAVNQPEVSLVQQQQSKALPGRSLSQQQGQQLVHAPAEAGAAALPARQALRSTRQQQKQQQPQEQKRLASNSSPVRNAEPGPRQRLTAELFAVAAAAAANLDDSCYAARSSVPGRRPVSKQTNGESSPAGAPAGVATAATTASRVGLALRRRDGGTRQDGSSKLQRCGPAPASLGVQQQHGARLVRSMSLCGSVQLGSRTVLSSRAGWSRTQDWLQQHHGVAGQPAAMLPQQQPLQRSAGPPARPAPQQHVQVEQSTPAAACAAAGASAAAAAASLVAAASLRCASSISTPARRRSSSGVVLERLGSRAAALKQLLVLRRNPEAVAELVQSLKAWHASPEAEAAGKLAARSSMQA